MIDVYAFSVPRGARCGDRVSASALGTRMNTEHILEEVGQQFSVIRECIRQLEARAAQAETPEPVTAAAELSGPMAFCKAPALKNLTRIIHEFCGFAAA